MRRVDDEQGAVTVTVALMLVVLFGMSALVIDVGHMFWERRQLQNGADAAALALAGKCADGTIADCATATVSTLGNDAAPYADRNANDGATGVPMDMVHGTDPALCEPGTDDAPNPLTDGETVKVSTETIDASTGNTFLTHWLAPVLGIDTTTVTACAVAGWGDYPGQLNTIPLAISMCEYDPDETTIYPGPHRNSTAPQQTLLFHRGTSGDEEPCAAQAGHDTDGDGSLPAGFGWLEDDGDCNIVTNVVDGDEWVDKEEGNDPACDDSELSPLLDTVIQLPVFNDFCRPAHDDPPDCPDYSNGDKYRIETYASFYLEGYRFPATSGGDYSPCTASQSCIVGYFTESSTLEDGVGGGPEGGAILVELKD